MTTPEHDLREVLHRIGDQVQPRDRLAEIRRQTRVVRPVSRWRPMLLTVGSVAAVLVAVAMVSGQLLGTHPPRTHPDTAAAAHQALALARLAPTTRING